MLVLLTTRSLLHLFWSICLAQALAQGHELAGFGGQKTALSQCRLVPQAAGARRSPQPSPGTKSSLSVSSASDRRPRPRPSPRPPSARVQCGVRFLAVNLLPLFRKCAEWKGDRGGCALEYLGEFTYKLVKTLQKRNPIPRPSS